MRGMNSESVDLIYLDPPFNSNTNYAAPIGSEAAGAEFKDMWSLSDIDIEWIDMLEHQHLELYHALLIAPTNSDKSYLAYMIPRILEMKRLLKPTGSIYLHCDPTMSHYLKILMDVIFGRKAFRNEIVWCYAGGGVPKNDYPRKHDVILRYAGKGNTFHVERKPYGSHAESGQRATDIGGTRSVEYNPKGTPVNDWWADIKPLINWNSEKIGYPTQKPLSLLGRIIKASSNESDIVLDPFCGCATTCIAADKLNRKWVGIDISPKAADLVIFRMRKELGVFSIEVVHRKDIPHRTDLGKLPRYNCKDHKEYLYGKQGGRCKGCNDWFKPHQFEVDHFIATSKGGTDHIENLQLLCGHCNRTKGHRGMEYLKTKLKLAA